MKTQNIAIAAIRPRPVAQPKPPPPPKKRITRFDVQVGISATVLAFGCGMLATKRGEPGTYLPVITSIVAYWLPSPTHDDD